MIDELIALRNTGLSWRNVVLALNNLGGCRQWTVAQAIAAYSYHCPESIRRPPWLRAGKTRCDDAKPGKICLFEGCRNPLGKGLRFLCRQHFERGF